MEETILDELIRLNDEIQIAWLKFQAAVDAAEKKCKCLPPHKQNDNENKNSSNNL